MNLYADSDLPIRAALVQAHTDTLHSFAAPGHWYSGAERRALVTAARQARVEAGLQEVDASSAGASVSSALPASVQKIARQVAVSTNDLERSFFEQALAAGISDAQYVEIVGVVSRVVNVDVFARGIGVPLRPLPAATDGAPSQHRPRTARDEGAWVPTIPGGARGEDEAKQVYGSADPQAAPFIYRALSLVPGEAVGLMQLGAAQYLEISNFMDLEFTFEPTLTRPQYELLAARVSALNECFY